MPNPESNEEKNLKETYAIYSKAKQEMHSIFKDSGERSLPFTGREVRSMSDSKSQTRDNEGLCVIEKLNKIKYEKLLNAKIQKEIDVKQKQIENKQQPAVDQEETSDVTQTKIILA